MEDDGGWAKKSKNKDDFIPTEFKVVPGKPTPKNFKLPETDEEMETIVKALESDGAMRIEAEATIKTRRAAYNWATNFLLHFNYG